jgi:N6-adenosine-specific RNA methylase IME4
MSSPSNQLSDIPQIELFVVDPPWPVKKGGLREVRPNQGRELDYQTLSVSEIFTILDDKVFTLATLPHLVFLWTVEKFLLEAEEAMLERGYKRHCRLVWDKLNGPCPGFTVRFSHEYLIWFYKPKLIPVAKTKIGKYLTIFQERAREHSRKPDIAYRMLNQMYPSLTKMDVFSREQRRGWYQWGNEINYFPPKSASLDNFLNSND